MQKNKFSGIFMFVIFMMACSFLLVAPQTAHAQGKTIMVIAPHPDDESLCCAGIIYAAKQAGNTVKVVVETNGDFTLGVSGGNAREGETVAAMQQMGLSEQDVIFLGYGDGTTMSQYQSASATQVFTSHAGQTQTYATRGLGGMSYHQFLTGTPGQYDRQDILSDFVAVLQNFHPDEIYTTSLADEHPDHKATGAFTAQALIILKKQGLLPNTRVHETLIHVPCESCLPNYHWPNTVFTPTLPMDMPSTLNQSGYSWTQAEFVPVPAAMQDSNRPTNLKNSVITAYQTQGGGDSTSWLFSWVKKNEVFWIRDYASNVAVLATATASSAAGTQPASAAIDGTVCGYPLGFCNSQEWAPNNQVAGAWIQLNWTTPVTLSGVTLYDRQNLVDNILAGTLSFSDGSTVPVGALQNGGSGVSVLFSPRTVTSVRFTVTGGAGQNAGLAEIEALGSISGSSTNFAPGIIQGPFPNQSTILDSQTIDLNGSGYDVNGDTLTYSWAASGGSISGAGVFTPPTVASPTVFTITLTVSDGHGNSAKNVAFITVTHTAAISSLTLNPSSIKGGSSATGTVTLDTVAPAGGALVALTSNNTTPASFPSTVTVPAGSTSANFTVTTVASSDIPQNITATYAGVSQVTTLYVTASTTIYSLTLNPTSVIEPGISTGTVTLNGPAPSGGQVTQLVSGTSATSVPSSITISAGSSTGTFQVSTNVVGSPTPAAIAAVVNNLASNATLLVNPPGNSVASVSLNPTTVTGGASSTGTITLNSAAPPGGLTITLSSSNTLVATVPSTVHISTGQITATFTVTTVAVASSTSVLITASYNGASQQVPLDIHSPSVSSVSMNPTTVPGGTSSTGTVTLTGVAPTGGASVSLSSSNGAAVPPATVTVNAGATSATFTTITSSVSSVTSATITAAYNNTSDLATLTINPPPTAPAFTSTNHATFTVGTAGSFTVTASGFPIPTLSESGTLPTGVTFTAATGVLSGTPTVTGTFNLVFTAHNTSGPNATQNFTLTVNQAPAITSANNTAFTINTPGSFTVTATGVPTPTLSESGALPNGVTFTAATGVLSGTPTIGGTFNIVFTAHNTASPDATQNFTLTVKQAPAITSANNATFMTGTTGSFTVTASGYPAPTLSESGALPNGVTFTAATGVLSGTPTVTGTFNLIFTAHNTSGPDATQNFALTVNQAPAITSANNATFTIGAAGSFTVTATGVPTPSLSKSGALPNGVTFTAATGVLSGTPTVTGTFNLIFTAHNTSGADATQNFTLTVGQAPAITSVNTTTFTTGTAGSFTVTTTGYPTPTLSESGALPNGVNFDIPSGTLSGTPTVSGTFNLVFTSHNASGADATQNFTLSVNPVSITIQNPSFETTNTLNFNCGTGCAYNSGAGIPGWTTQGSIIGSWQTGSFITLPPADGLVVAYNDGGTISQVLTSTLQPNTMYTLSADVGTSASGSSATYSIQLLAGGQILNTFQGAITDLPVGSLVTKTVSYTSPASVSPGQALEIRLISTGMEFDVDNVTLTLNFNPTAPTIASTNHASFSEGSAGTFLVAITGFPAPTVSESGALPSGVTFNTNTNVLGGTPAGGTAGTYPITFTAHNSSGPDAVQNFTLTVSLNSIAIQNPSFETTNTLNFDCGAGCAYNQGAGIPGWTTQGSIMGSWQTGPYITLPPADGLVVAYNDGGTISQVLTSTLQPNTMYTLSADVSTSASGSSATYSVQLLAGGQVLNTFQGAVTDLPVGSLITKTVNYTSPASVSPGQALEIRLISNGVEFDVDNVTLTLNFNPTAPTIASANHASFTEGNAGTFSVAMTGFPAPTVSQSGALPSGVTFNTSTNVLSGTPAAGTAGTYPITFTAHNSSGPDAVQNFTLTVNPAPNYLTIQNPSFEVSNSLSSSCGTGCAYNAGVGIPGWTAGPNTGSWQVGSGVLNLPASDGLVIAFSNGGTISQVLSSTLQPNTTYTLSADIGHRSDGLVTDYTIQLLAGGQVLNTFVGNNGDIPAGTFASRSVTYTSPSNVNPNQALEIRFTNSALQLDIDNVSLTAE